MLRRTPVERQSAVEASPVMGLPLHLSNGERYVYPDLSVVCGPPQVEPGDVITYPSILIEVLAGSTEQYDRGLKWG